MSVLRIETAEVFKPLLAPARYKGAFGGRGSCKSWFFADSIIRDSITEPGECAGQGLLTVCIRENQKSLKDSSKRLIEHRIQDHDLGRFFKIWHDKIETPGDGIIIFQGMQDHTAESIKSLEGFKRAYVEEAQTLSSTSLELLKPTIRVDGAERWFSWNPRYKTDAVDMLLRGTPPYGSEVVNSNWRDNPWFSNELKLEREDDLTNNPDRYDHIWEGAYRTVVKGAYYAASISKTRAENRVGVVPADPLMTYRAYWDIGGTGLKADAVAIWIVQFVGQTILLLNYYEAQGQPLATHVNWLRDNGYEKAYCVLPHDGKQGEKTIDATYESSLKAAGFDVKVIPNQGKGAAMIRVTAGRRIFGACWFNETTTESGLMALGAYHEKRNEMRGIGLGAEHDWASDGADAFGLMAIDHKVPTVYRKPNYAKQDRAVI